MFPRPSKIRLQGRQVGEAVWCLAFPDMLVIALAGLVVIAQQAYAVRHQGKPILEAMSAAAHGIGHPPDDNFHERRLRQAFAFAEQQFSFHVGIYANKSIRCQSLQQRAIRMDDVPSTIERAQKVA